MKTPIKLWRNKKTFIVSAYINPNQDHNVFEELDIVGNVIQPDPVPANEIIVDNTSIQAALDLAKPGDTVLVKNGTYFTDVTGDDYYAPVHIMKPVTLKAYPGHKPVIDCRTTQTWAILIGDARANIPTPIPNVTIDGFEIKNANRNGIRAIVPDHLIIKNCSVRDNNAGWWKWKVFSYEYGIMVLGGKSVTIDGCRIYNNGGGINFYEDETVTPLNGCKDAIVRNNFIYANANSGNMGNSSGLACRFTERIKVYDNIFYDGCDANINGLGAIHSQFTGNVLLNAWQPGGNNEGIKFAVRGGGNNLVAFNIIAFNGNTGFDATDGIGDVFLNNTVYGNDSWGMLMEGSNTAVLNTISAGNTNVRNQGSLPKDFRPPNAGGIEAISSVTSYNLFTDTEHDITYFLEYIMPHTLYATDPKFVTAPLALPRRSPDQVIHPEELFGAGVTIASAKYAISNNYLPALGSPAIGSGLSLANVSLQLKSTKDAVVAKLNARIELWKNDTDTFQHLQAVEMWRRILRDFDNGSVVFGDLPLLTDFNGKVVPMISTIGAVQ